MVDGHVRSQRKCRFQVDKYLIADDIFTQVYCIEIRLALPLYDSVEVTV